MIARAIAVVIASILATAMPAPAQDAPPAGAAATDAELAARADAAIAAARELPSALDLDEPWTASVAAVALEVQPMTGAELEELAGRWLELLQRELRKRTNLEIARDAATDGDVAAELATRAVAQQDVVLSIVERIKPVLSAWEARGGDTTQIDDYISAATGQKMNVGDPVVLWAQISAWFRSSEGGIRLGLNLLSFLGTLFAFWIVSRLLGRLVGVGLKRMPNSSSLLREFIVGGTRRLTLIIGLIVAVSALGVDITPFLAAIGAAGLVIGLALQGTLSNFASGILILIYRPYDVGNVINAGGVVGKVEAMNLVSTTVVTPDNQAMVVPNNQIWNGVITNVTGRRQRRVDLVFGIGYSDDIARAIAAIEAEFASHELVLADPEPVVRVHELGDNSVNLIARPWAKTEDYWTVYWDLMRSVKERFDAEGISIPFPQRDLHIPGAIEVRVTQ